MGLNRPIIMQGTCGIISDIIYGTPCNYMFQVNEGTKAYKTVLAIPVTQKSGTRCHCMVSVSHKYLHTNMATGSTSG